MPQDKQNRMQTAGEQPQAMAEKGREVDEEKKHAAMTRKQLSSLKASFAAEFPVLRFPWSSTSDHTAVKSAAAHSGVAKQAPQHVATSATVPTAMAVPESAEAAKSVQLEFGCGFAAGA